MDLWEIRVEIAADAAEAAELVLLESGCLGWTLLEDAVARRAWIVGIFESREEAESRWSEIRPVLAPAAPGPPVSRRLAHAEWARSYQRHFKPWTFGRLHWVPAWERKTFRPPAGHAVLWLDPGLAFGTGNHETTRLCIERLVEFDSQLGGAPGRAREGRVVDAGCGSGILALSASLLGFRDVVGFDHDAEAVRVSCENAELNGLSDRVRFMTAPLSAGLGGAEATLVLANLQADVLARHARELAGSVAPGGWLEMSGILACEEAAVRDAFALVAPGWAHDTRILGEWCDLCLKRPPGA